MGTTAGRDARNAGTRRRADRPVGAITFVVPGTPETAGSKRGFVVKGRAVVTDANPRTKSWQHQVRTAAGTVYAGPLLTGPVGLVCSFYFVRPKSHYGSGRNRNRLKASAPREHTQAPDVLKLARAIEDALSQVVWRDDSQVIQETLSKYWSEPGEPACAVVGVHEVWQGRAPQVGTEE